MATLRKVLVGFVVLTALASSKNWSLDAQGVKANPKAATHWIWLDAKAEPKQTVYFRKEISLSYRVISAKLYGSCDNSMTVYINGKEIISSDEWETPVFREVTDALVNPTKTDEPIRNVVAVKAHNTDGVAGLLLRVVMDNSKKQTIVLATDGTWKVASSAGKGWQNTDFDDSAWKNAVVVGKLGAKPWDKVTETALQGVVKIKKATATPIELIKVKKDYKVELLYSVPRQTQGSWVNLCVDPKGRLITSDQYGKLYRVTPPALNGKADDTKVEELPVDLGEAQGLVWAFDSLYVVVNRGKKYDSGLYRVTSSKNDDVLDTKELLRKMEGSSEHGPHAVAIGPDGKSLYVIAGNHTKPVKTHTTTVPPIWGEDFLVPRLWDASGHAVGIMAPGGCVYKTDPDGKKWEMISVGYRNQFDIAFNRDGELFTYDSDMEWDMSLPWYRPTRVCHAVPGSEFGWRGGSGKMYEYHPDNLPPVVNVGPGSPCGIAFGYGSKFPAKYRESLFLCDWSYGKLYALHMKEDGASYTGELEEFLNGSPLPLTDVIVNPKDGALYFTIGGRNTMSGLYRVTYVGKESTEEPESGRIEISLDRVARKNLEKFYGKQDPKAVQTAWPFLNHKDRFLRYAARTVLEFQDPATWQAKALAETDPIARIHTSIALARLNVKAKQANILEGLNGIDFAKLSTPQKIDLLRAYQLAYVRLGAGDASVNTSVGKRLLALYPAAEREVNTEMCKILCHLETPGALTKSLDLLAKSPTQEDQIETALSLRTVKTGWSIQQREEYFNWFHKAANYRGGNSFHGFLRNIRTDAIKMSLNDDERTALKTVLDVTPTPTAPKFTFKQRPFVKKYTVDELLPAVEKGLVNRNFDQGRDLFGEAKCFVCHRFANEGGGLGPDLTQVIGRFGPRDLLESIIEPSKVVSDQYAAIIVNTTDGRQIAGRVVNLAGDNMMISTDMFDPNKLVAVNRNLVESITHSKVSQMPEGLIDTFTRDEILDLAAYLYSRGDRSHKMFRKE